jgi:hypothetical protein
MPGIVPTGIPSLIYIASVTRNSSSPEPPLNERALNKPLTHGSIDGDSMHPTNESGGSYIYATCPHCDDDRFNRCRALFICTIIRLNIGSASLAICCTCMYSIRHADDYYTSMHGNSS